MKRWWISLIAIGLLVILVGLKGRKVDKTQFSQTKELTSLRNIAHQVLLSSGDKTSRILPVQELSADAFSIRFEKPFTPVPDSLVSIFKRNFKAGSEYAIEIRELSKNEIVYSFVLFGDSTRDIVPCLERPLPQDFYELSIHISSEKLLPFHYLAGLTILLLFGGGWAFLKSRRRTKAAPVIDKENTAKYNIGQFCFYPDQQKLELKGNYIECTGKESHLLFILAQSPNAVINRSRLQKEIWEDEGVVVTRSLDMFVSKLRKKLKDDQSVRITNVHGKGYKLELA